MTDQATANLPSRDLDKTAAFYEALGFKIGFKDDGWMILTRGDLQLEFFPHRSANELLFCLPAGRRPRRAPRRFQQVQFPR